MAHDEELKREVALKQIKEQYADHPDSRARFIFEAEVTGRLEHPGVVPVYGLGRHPTGRPYYAMRFVRGEAMREAVRRFHQADRPGRDPGERALELRELLARFLDVCDTVAYAHSRGVLHRDLKPDNVLLGPYGETLVVDWGVARLFDPRDGEAPGGGAIRPASAEALPPSRIGQLIGTWAYMAPEQAAGLPDEVGPHTDIYGLGAILFDILTGRPPHAWPGRTPDPPRAAPRGRAMPPALEEIAARAARCAGQADRWPTATALADAVRRWLADEPIAGHRALLAQRERLAAERPGVAEYAAELARHRVNLGLVLQGMGRHADAEAMYRAAAADCERLASAHPAETRYRADLAMTRVHLARALRALGRAREAAEVERAAVADYERLRETNPHDYRTGLTVAHHHPDARRQRAAARPGARRAPADGNRGRGVGRVGAAGPRQPRARPRPAGGHDSPHGRRRGVGSPTAGAGGGDSRTVHHSARTRPRRRQRHLARPRRHAEPGSGPQDAARRVRGRLRPGPLRPRGADRRPAGAPQHRRRLRRRPPRPGWEATFIIQHYVRGPALQRAIRDYHDRKRQVRASAGGYRADCSAACSRGRGRPARSGRNCTGCCGCFTAPAAGWRSPIRGACCTGTLSRPTSSWATRWAA